MSMMGQLAALDDYDPNGGFGMSPDEMTSRIARDPTDAPNMRERILDYQRSPVGQMQDYYRQAPKDAWLQHDVSELGDDLVGPNPGGMNLFAAGPQEAPFVAAKQAEGVKDVAKEAADWVIPQSPSDAALTFALGPFGSKLARTAVGAAGAMGEMLDPAEAGVASKLTKAARSGLGDILKPAVASDVKNWRFPQYAERYPEVGPPITEIDKKTGREYLAKQNTPEADVFAKARTGVIADMRENGYTPYFDPAERFHVNPKNYPPNVDTTTIVPAKQATIDKHMETIGSDEARARLQAAYQRGSEMPNTRDWYALGQVEKAFTDELGAKAGRKAFQDRIATSMAATTGGADPTSNFLMSQYGNYLRANGLPYPQAAYDMPFPIGGRYATTNMAQHEKFFDQGGFKALGAENPKRHNFAQNFTGNRAAATMDEQMSSLMVPGNTMPPRGQYGLYEQVLRDEAGKVGVPPQNYQDVVWSGAKNLKDPRYTAGQPFIQTINESIERTHRLTGMPKDEIVKRGLIGGKIPMYAIPGAMGLGALADQSSYER